MRLHQFRHYRKSPATNLRPTRYENFLLAHSGVVVGSKTTVDMCITNACMGYVTGPAGIGKTVTFEEVERQHHGVDLITVDRSNRPPGAMARCICAKLKVGGAARQRKDLRELTPFEKIVKTLKGSHRLLVFDEAEKLYPATLEMLREIHDACKIGILLTGPVEVANKIHQTTNEDSGQLESRFGVRLDVRRMLTNPESGETKPLFTREQIRDIFKLPNVRLIGGSVSYLLHLVNDWGKGGGLRSAGYLLDMAVRLVRKREQLESTRPARVSEEDLKMVAAKSDSMHFDEIYAQCYLEAKQQAAESA